MVERFFQTSLPVVVPCPLCGVGMSTVGKCTKCQADMCMDCGAKHGCQGKPGEAGGEKES
jgi:hypothetical protein